MLHGSEFDPQVHEAAGVTANSSKRMVTAAFLAHPLSQAPKGADRRLLLRGFSVLTLNSSFHFLFHFPDMGVSQNEAYHFGGPHDKDYSILGSILGVPLCRETTILPIYTTYCYCSNIACPEQASALQVAEASTCRACQLSICVLHE